MKEITIKAPNEVLKVNIGDQSFSIPLGSSLPFNKMIEMSKAEGSDRLNIAYSLIMEHIPEGISLTMGEASQLINAWISATQEASGISPGES